MRKLFLAALVDLLLLAFLFAGCSPPHARQVLGGREALPPANPEKKPVQYVKISQEQAREMMNDDVIILDVRTEEEYEEGYIENAVLLPEAEIQEKIKTVAADKNQRILVYAQTGTRSRQASEMLIEMGYQKVYDFGGIESWTGEIVGNWLYSSYYNYFGGPLPPDIVIPVDFTTTIQINEQLPQFTVHLTGETVKRYRTSYDETKYYISNDETNINTLTITDDTGAFVQRIDGLHTENPSSEEYMYGLVFEDWNFDGYLDIGLWAYPGGSMRNNPHYYWLWDNSIGQFVENRELMKISDYSTITVLEEKKRLEGYTRYGASGWANHYYEYINNEFVMVYAVERETSMTPNEEGKFATRIITVELINGELVTTEEYYEE